MKHPLILAGITLALIACNNNKAPISDTTFDQGTAAKRVGMEWWAQNTREDVTGMPHNILTLRPVSDPGTVLYQTECNGTTLVEGVQDMDDSVATIQCWWAGGGDQYGVFIGDAEKATIRHRTVDEEAGYGQWEDLKTL